MFHAFSNNPHPPFALPLLLALIALIAIEFLWLRYRKTAHRDPAYSLAETAASTGVALGNALIRPLTALALTPLFRYAEAHQLWSIPLHGVAGFVVLFVVVDAVYYGFHRASHSVRWLWATHSVHHSTQHFNPSAAYRLGWTELLAGVWMFLLPLVWLGAPALPTLAAFALNLAFQFFLHTEAIGRLGWLERIFNTPEHHRVHHACNAELLDRNFGGVLIVWDRLFGSYAESDADTPLRFGIAGAAARYNPLAIAFAEWRRLLGDMRRAPSPLAAIRIALSKP
jgi:sterol desaturase/sphingolipid hydroxylase (fatty acid hydroxylase superfamily)